MKKYPKPLCPAGKGQRWLLLDLNRVMRTSSIIGFGLARGRYVRSSESMRPATERIIVLMRNGLMSGTVGSDIYTPGQTGIRSESRKLT